MTLSLWLYFLLRPQEKKPFRVASTAPGRPDKICRVYPIRAGFRTVSTLVPKAFESLYLSTFMSPGRCCSRNDCCCEVAKDCLSFQNRVTGEMGLRWCAAVVHRERSSRSRRSFRLSFSVSGVHMFANRPTVAQAAEKTPKYKGIRCHFLGDPRKRELC